MNCTIKKEPPEGVVGPAGFEPTTFTQQWRKANVYGFLHDRSRDSSSLSVSKPISSLSGARRHTCLDYDPTVSRRNAYCERASIKIFMPEKVTTYELAQSCYSLDKRIDSSGTIISSAVIPPCAPNCGLCLSSSKKG